MNIVFTFLLIFLSTNKCIFNLQQYFFFFFFRRSSLTRKWEKNQTFYCLAIFLYFHSFSPDSIHLLLITFISLQPLSLLRNLDFFLLCFTLFVFLWHSVFAPAIRNYFAVNFSVFFSSLLKCEKLFALNQIRHYFLFLFTKQKIWNIHKKNLSPLSSHVYAQIKKI